jgi:hypothetical protein
MSQCEVSGEELTNFLREFPPAVEEDSRSVTCAIDRGGGCKLTVKEAGPVDSEKWFTWSILGIGAEVAI